MINRNLLKFEVLEKPNKDYFKLIQANAKFKTLSDVIRTKVGINNFYNFGIALKSSILMRDIILNSQFVSGWARSSQVLNDNDSKFSVYKFLTRTQEQTNEWIKLMENFEALGHSMDNMRSLIYLDSVGEYAISIDILHLIYLALVLDDLCANIDSNNSDLHDESRWFLDNISDLLLTHYDINYKDFEQMLQDASRDFPTINLSKKISSNMITEVEEVYDVAATYSVVGQIWRHRTLVKCYTANSYTELVQISKEKTKDYDFSMIGMHNDIAEKVKEFTENANSAYDLTQGSIIQFNFSGTTGAIHKALSQRTCYINDSPQFKDAFETFEKYHPTLKLLPPCKLNCSSTNSCYVGYVNESRRRQEEKTQVPCPIYCKSKGYTEDFNKAKVANKTKWYIENLDGWKVICK